MSDTSASPPASNLTLDSRLVVPANGVDPIPGYHLVVYKRRRSSRELRASLAPGEKLRCSIRDLGETLFAYGVAATSSFRHVFERRYKDCEQLHEFGLEMALELRVVDPVSLVESVDRDPLHCLEEEAHHLVRESLRTVPWQVIEREHADLREVLLPESRAADGKGIDRLRTVASSAGLELSRFSISRKLSNADLEGARGDLDLERKRKAEATRRREMEVEQETARLRQIHRLELDDSEKKFARHHRVADGVADHGVRGFGQATDTIRSFADIREAAHLMGEMNSAFATPALAGRPLGSVGAGVDSGRLSAASGGGASSLRRLLDELLRALEPVDCGKPLKRQLLAVSLHLVAEAQRGEDADSESLERYRDAMSALFKQLVAQSCLASSDQTDLLRRLLNVSDLRIELAGD